MPPLAFHLLPQTNVSDWCSWASGQMAQQSAPWVKTCSAEHIYWLRLYGAQRVYYRPCFLPGDSGEGDCADGTAWGRIVAAEIARTGAHWPDAVGYRNEMTPTAANATQYHAYRAALRAAGFTGQVVYGSFSNGRPDWSEYATIPADADAIELHEYFGLTVAGSPDLALRHVDAIRRGLLSATLPLYIGETGADNCGDGQGTRGWRQKMTADQMAAQLAAYRAGCAPSVVAAFVFADGDNGDPQWASYATRGAGVEAAIRATWQQKGPTVQRGIDVSNAQGSPNWPAVAASGVTFAAVKATEGVGWPSPTFAAQWAGAGAANLTRIAYHFARPDLGNAPAAEAAYFVGVAGPVLRPGDLVALDLEVGSGDLSAWALGWLDAVTAALGFRPLCYSYPSFIVASLRAPALAAYPLWYASYQATEPPAPAPWSSIAIWQDSDATSVPGVGGLVDGDVTWLAAADLRGLGKPAPDPQPQGGLQEVITITPAIQAAARARLGALGGKVVPGGAIETELIARFALGQANPQLGTAGVTPVVGSEVALPDGRAYCLLDSGELCEWANGRVDNPEQKDRAAILAQCWPGRFA